MQVHGPSDIIKDGSGISVELNPGGGAPFADMRIGPVRLYIGTPEECDWIIAAAAEAKALLLGDPRHSLTWCPAVTDIDGCTLYCDRDPGHAGSHHSPGPDAGSEVAWGGEDDDEDYPPLSEAAELDELEPLPRNGEQP